MAFTKEQLDAYIQALYDDDGQLSEADNQLIINYILSNGEPETDPRDLIQIRRGNEADLPTLAQGELGYTLDTEKLFIGGLYGSKRINYKEIEEIDAISSKINGLVSNVKEYEDLVVSNDWGPAISAAIDSLTDGGVVFFPAGTYRITTAIDIQKTRVYLKGAGRGVSLIYLDSAVGNAIFFHGNLVGGISSIGVSDLSINCFDGSDNTRTSGAGIYMGSDVGDFIIKNVKLLNCYDGIVLDNAATGEIDTVNITESIEGASNRGIFITNNSISNRISDVNIVCHDTGLLVDSGTDTLVVENCTVQKSGAAQPISGFKLRNFGSFHNPRWIRFLNCFAEAGDSGVGYNISSSQNLELNGCYNLGGLNGVTIGGSSNDIKIIGGCFFQSINEGVLINSAENVLVMGATITKNSQSGSGVKSGLTIAPGLSNLRIIDNFIGDGLNDLSSLNYQSYGVNVAAGSTDYYIIKNNDLTGNINGGLNDGGTGTNKFVSDNLL